MESAVTEEIFEYESKGRVFRTTYDPRESGLHCFISLYAWAEPNGLLIAPEDYEEILDGLWLVVREGARAILSFEYTLNCYVARRWTYPDDFLLAQINATLIDVLELGRTMRVPYKEKPGLPPGNSVAIPDASAGEWLYPERRPVTAAEWSALRPRLN
ncbi:MAG: hypothetical protein ABI421_21870, partial [Polyangiaceae bacterium]